MERYSSPPYFFRAFRCVYRRRSLEVHRSVLCVEQQLIGYRLASSLASFAATRKARSGSVDHRFFSAGRPLPPLPPYSGVCSSSSPVYIPLSALLPFSFFLVHSSPTSTFIGRAPSLAILRQAARLLALLDPGVPCLNWFSF